MRVGLDRRPVFGDHRTELLLHGILFDAAELRESRERVEDGRAGGREVRLLAEGGVVQASRQRLRSVCNSVMRTEPDAGDCLLTVVQLVPWNHCCMYRCSLITQQNYVHYPYITKRPAYINKVISLVISKYHQSAAANATANT